MSDIKIKNGLVVDEYGNKRWYKNNLLHREGDLPAVETSVDGKQWWINGQLHRDNDLHAVEYSNGDKEWYQYGELHREKAPAKFMFGNKYWMQHNKKHREDGPAVIYTSGKKKWWINGEELSQEAFNHYVEMKKLNEQLKKGLINKNNNKKIFKL